MSLIIEYVPFIVMMVTVAILIVGVVLMALGNKLNVKYSTKLMTMRVVSQALVVIVLALLYYLQKK